MVSLGTPARANGRAALTEEGRDVFLVSGGLFSDGTAVEADSSAAAGSVVHELLVLREVVVRVCGREGSHGRRRRRIGGGLPSKRASVMAADVIQTTTGARGIQYNSTTASTSSASPQTQQSYGPRTSPFAPERHPCIPSPRWNGQPSPQDPPAPLPSSAPRTDLDRAVRTCRAVSAAPHGLFRDQLTR